jgi:hypothetical protein
MLHMLQTLPVRTAKCAIHLLCRVPPIESYIDCAIGSLLCGISYDTEHPLHQIALYQLATSKPDSKSWFVYATNRLTRYGIESTAFLRNNGCLPKNSITSIIKTYWANQLKEEASTKPSLQYLSVGNIDTQAAHILWSSIGTNKSDTKKATVKAKMLAGTYILQANRAAFNQYTVEC